MVRWHIRDIERKKIISFVRRSYEILFCLYELIFRTNEILIRKNEIIFSTNEISISFVRNIISFVRLHAEPPIHVGLVQSDNPDMLRL